MSQLFGYQSISEVLNAEFARRKRRNDSYSMRAFARDLQMSPARLSEVLNGSGLSEKTGHKIATALKFKSIEKNFWSDLILAECSRSKKQKTLAKQRLKEARKTGDIKFLKEEQFRTISEWQHAAILELTQVQEFKSDFKWVAEQLDLKEKQVYVFVERLQRLGLLHIKEDGSWHANPEAYSTFSDVPSTAIRRFHRQIMMNGIDALWNRPMQERAIQSMILAIPQKRLPEFHQEMKNILLKFWENLEGQEKDSLYSLSIQLCPVRKSPSKTDKDADTVVN